MGEQQLVVPQQLVGQQYLPHQLAKEQLVKEQCAKDKPIAKLKQVGRPKRGARLGKSQSEAPPAGYDANYLVLMMDAVNEAVQSGQDQQLADGQRVVAAIDTEQDVYNSWKFSVAKGDMAGFGGKSLTLSQMAKAVAAVDNGRGDFRSITSIKWSIGGKHFSKKVHGNLSHFSFSKSFSYGRTQISGSVTRTANGSYVVNGNVIYNHTSTSWKPSQKVRGEHANATYDDHNANWSSKTKTDMMQQAQTLYQQAEIEQQRATQCADGGTQAMQNQVGQDSTNNQQKVVLANSVNQLMQQVSNLILS